MYEDKPKRKNDEKHKNDESASKSHIMEYMLIVIAILVVAVCVLALMGPSIGNIFSNITSSCLCVISYAVS